MKEIQSVRPWSASEPCPLPRFDEFKEALNSASYHNAAEQPGEGHLARSRVETAADIAIDQGWPLWAMERMFKEVRPLVDWSSFLQKYISILYENQQ